MRQRRRGVRALDDPGLSWIRLASAGMLHPGNEALMERAIEDLPSTDPVLEIGSFCGMSTNALRYLLLNHGRTNTFFTTDPWEFEGEPEDGAVPGTDVAVDAYRTHIVRQFTENLRFWGKETLPHSFRLTSDAFFAAWVAGQTCTDIFGRSAVLGGPLSFVFIDGDHRREQAERDFEHVDSVLVPGGYVLFDDSDRFGAFPHVYDVVQLALDRGYELVESNPNHLVRKVAGNEPRPRSDRPATPL